MKDTANGILRLDRVPVCSLTRALADAERVSDWKQDGLVYYRDYTRNGALFRVYFPEKEEAPESYMRVILDVGQYRKVFASDPSTPVDPLSKLKGEILPCRAELDLDSNEISFDIGR